MKKKNNLQLVSILLLSGVVMISILMNGCSRSPQTTPTPTNTGKPTDEITASPSEPPQQKEVNLTVFPTSLPTNVPTDVPEINLDFLTTELHPVEPEEFLPTIQINSIIKVRPEDNSTEFINQSELEPNKENGPHLVQEAKIGELNRYTFEDFGFPDDTVFRDCLSDHNYAIQLPGTWNIQSDIQLTVLFSHSEEIQPSSKMTVDWNDKQIGSVRLSDENKVNGKLMLFIPKDRIKRGLNWITIQFFTGISYESCIENKNSTIWTSVSKNSFLELTPAIDFSNNDLSQIPEMILDTSPLSGNVINFVIPDTLSGEEFSKAARTASGLGNLLDWNRYKMEVYTVSESATAKVNGPVITIMGK